MKSIQRSSLTSRFQRICKLINNSGVCIYCGVPASTKDHFLPLSVAYMLSDVSPVEQAKVLVPSCAECNSFAGDKVFNTVAGKRRFIQAKIRRRYKKLLASPSWSNEELAEVGLVLQDYIISEEVKKRWILERLKWKNKANSAAAELAKINLRLGVIGKYSAAPNANNKTTKLNVQG